MSDVMIAVLIAAFFYMVFPLIGAFTVRHRWRKFRSLIIKTSVSKEISYSDIDNSDFKQLGEFSFTGELEAIQGDSTIWLSNGKISVRVEMSGIKTYVLPSSESINNEDRIEENKEMLPGEMPKRVSWNKLYSIVQGTGICIFGSVFIEKGTPVFRNTEETPLFVVIYDGSKDTILRRSVWSGRQINEYWHNLTPFSLVAGSFCLFVLSFNKFKNPGYNYYALAILILSLLPGFPFCPPGIVFYFGFKRFWRNSRYLRGERDLLRLSLRSKEYTTLDSCKAALEEYPEAKIRSCGLIKENNLQSLPCRIYGYNDDNNIPENFREKLIIPGSPDKLAMSCRKKARLYEVLAMSLLFAGVAINLIIVTVVLYLIV